MRIKPTLYGILVIVVFMGTILAFQAAGIWSTSGKVTNDGEQVLPSVDDVESIKGWMTLEQISTVYKVPLADLLARFELPADTAPTTAIKDLETEVFSVTNLRIWLLELQSPAGTATVETAPVETGPVETAPVETAPVETGPALEATTIPTKPAVESSPTEAVVGETPVVSATEHIAPDKTVTGKTTFQDLLDWGVPADAIQKIIGGDLPASSTIIKDHITAISGDFTSVKSALQAEVDKANTAQ